MENLICSEDEVQPNDSSMHDFEEEYQQNQDATEEMDNMDLERNLITKIDETVKTQDVVSGLVN